MAWRHILKPDYVKKAALKYLLQRYLGHFVEDGELSLDQLSLDLFEGTGCVTNVTLDPQALNEFVENFPLEFVAGHVKQISVSIPLTAMLSKGTFIEISGLKLTIQPRQRPDIGTSMFDSVWKSTSIIQMAQECAQQSDNNEVDTESLEGVELFAKTIDQIFSKIKVRFMKTVIRLEHMPMDSTTGVATEIHIDNLEYFDEAGSDPTTPPADYTKSTKETREPKEKESKDTEKLNFTIKCFYFEGVSFHTDEFPARERTFAKNVTNSSRGSTPDSKNSEGQFSSAQISPMQTPPEKHVTNNLHESSLIMFAKLFGRQEIGLKIKRDEGLVGPKVEVSVDFGPIALFLSPRQVHVLIELMCGLASPDMEDVSNVMPKHMYAEKRMAPSDFNRVERELANQLNPLQGLRTMDLRHTQGWSTGSLDDSDNEDEFLPMRPVGTMSMNTSITSNVTSMDGSFSGSNGSSKNSFTGYSKQRKYRHNMDADPLTETIKFGVSASSLAIILLHEDILTVSFEAYGPTKASTTMMKTVSENFFKRLLTAPNYGNRDFEKLREVFANICQYSHLRLLAAPLIIDGNQKSAAKYSGTSGNLLLANFELVECLIDTTSSNDASNSIMFIDLLTFPKNSTSNAALLNRTNVEMKFHHTQKALKRNQMTIYTHPRTEFNITLAPCQCEFDITIIDRISNLLNMQPICVSSPASAATRGNINRNNLFHQAVESPSLPDSRIDIKVSATKCDIVVRFPVPDLRPLHDLNRVPWWKRSVRSDYMTLHLTDGKLHTSIESRLPYVARHEVQCRRLFISYTEVDSDTPIVLGKATADEYRTDDSLHNEGEGFGWPRMVIIVYPQNVGVPLDDSSDGEAEHSSLDDTLESTPRHQPSPFSSKRIIHESDTPHSRPQNPHDHNSKETREGEELIIPGNRKEMMEFIEEGTRNCRIQLEIGLPCASVQIPSKHLYELIYNRINTDLLLWEPSAPRPKYMQHAETNIGLDASTMLQDSCPQKFSMCKSAIQDSSESDSEDEGIFQSATSKVGHRAKYGSTLKNGQSKVALTLTISQGILTIFTPVRDSLRNVIPGQQGEIIIRVDDFILFSVTNYKGDENLGYVCMISKDVTLYHCDLITMPPSPPSLRSINSMIPKHCLRTIYRNEPGANLSTNYIEKDMLVVAIRIQSAHETHRIKTFRVAVGISQATLKHKVCTSQTLWFTQLTDCLDVIDHPVSGYTPPGVLTELHVHLWECAIDYRPIHLPLRSMISLGSFSISSNIAAQTNTSTLGFIAEDVAFFISDKMGKLVDLKHDYVCVMDLGLFELSLRLNEKMVHGAPRFDLRASNNILHIRTCSDSARALMQLLTYFANDGDLASNCGSTESITVPSSEDGESLLGEESISLLSRSQVERVYSLIDEAMEETEKTEPAEKTKGSSQQPIQSAEFAHPDEWDDFVQSGQFEQPELIGNSQQTAEKKKKEEMFFFPDENNAAKQDSKQTHASSLSDYGDTDDEFCILGEEAGVGIMPQGGVPEVRWLCQESLRIVDNYFSVPLGKTDPLKAPANFPPAVLRYTLCEMTLIWQMYGGKDFGDPQPVAKKHITINEKPVYYYGRSRSATETTNSQASPNRINFGSMPNSPLARNKESSNDWMKHGGPGRRKDIRMDLQLNKVRFQHEVYPENTHEASRQILLINQIEVTDKLLCSDINKFLYQYSSEAKPRQSHASMFTMKAVHVRPDPKLTVQECCLKLSLLPVRLNIDQDSLLFLIQYFTELTGGFKQTSDNTTMPNNMQSAPGSKHGTPTHHPPVMSVNDDSDDVDSNVDESDMETNLMLVFEDEFTVKENKSSAKTISESQENSQPVYFRIVPKKKKKRPNLQSGVIFFRSVIFSPEVLIRLDYVGKHVDLTWGPLEGLLLGLARLNCSELKLKRLAHRHGLLGFDKLMSYLFSEWIQDIKKNQLPSILGGVGPMYSLVQLFQGIRDLFWMPIEQYQKDGRIVRGLQRGANSFTTSSAMAALELTSRLVYALQSTAETAYDMVSPGPSVRCKAKGQRGRRKRYNQPIDIREGMTNAYHLVKEGLGETATQLVRVANEEHEQKGVSGAVGGVLRQIPPTVVKPIILATEATNNVLTGMVSQLVPDVRHEASQKWRQEDVHDVN